MRDEIDQWGVEWARQRRIALGIIPGDKIEPRERLGKLRCTLGQIQKERVGAGEGHRRNHDFPEVYVGISLLVHRAYMAMPGNLRVVMHLQYVWREIPVEEKIKEIGIKKTQYWADVAAMKSFLHGAVVVNSEPSGQQKDYA
jgi:hypothetical protein